ncbi:hypothetical protein [Alcanivorax sp.]|uniref:hypothetical protein n=1 Tax=Alcanivorax sp. TaxID=1872427 RepID=UPI003BA97FBE
MKARPILFNTDMVKAILAGQKRQTRREVKHWKDERLPKFVNGAREAACPYGQPGDLLYVRETFRLYDSSIECACYDHCECSRHHGKPMYFADGFSAEDELKWKPSIHMPREFSRLTLEITDVRVERLHEITGADARAEGFSGGHGAIPGYGYSATPVEHFVHVWDSIYRNWKSNPWVWVIEFKAHHCNVDALLREREAA